MSNPSRTPHGGFDESWLSPHGIVPVDSPTTGALIREIQRLRESQKFLHGERVEWMNRALKAESSPPMAPLSLPWTPPFKYRADLGYVVDADGKYVCVSRASLPDEHNAIVADALNAFAAMRMTR